MADVREKLVELLWKYDQLRMMRMSIEESADYLIDNGVTIQRWIPVTEHLPNEPREYNVIIGGAEIATTLYFNGESFCDDDGNCYPVTRWTPLPQAPGKEERA